MGLHLCYDLSADRDVDARQVVAELHAFARALPFEQVGPVLDSAHAGNVLSGATWLLPLDRDGRVREREWEPPKGTPWRWVAVEPEAWVGFQVHPGRGCERATFGLARHPATVEHEGREHVTSLEPGWRWHAVCKTQYASTVSWDHFMTLHGSLVSVLDHAATLGIVIEVRDETGFWDERDWGQAVEETGRMNGVVSNVAQALRRALDERPEPD